MQPLSARRIQSFRKTVYAYYRLHGRDLPWRKTRNPYHILVSEIMLQQTQVGRVLEKYPLFLAQFPDFPSLAQTPLPPLLRLWQGMGYNRRALSLRALAQEIVSRHGGHLPQELRALLALPGIGTYTANALLAFVFNKPVVVIDTNIRRVYIQEFYPEGEDIHDRDLTPLIWETLDRRNPRRWYNALMDYGAMLKMVSANPNKRSVHYSRQSPFENSNRQVRSHILKALLSTSPLTIAEITAATGCTQSRLERNLVDLVKEGFLREQDSNYFIAGDSANDV